MHALLSVSAYALILFASSMTGFSIARNYVQRPRQLQEIITALQILQTEIMYSATPLPEALGTAARACGGVIASFILQVSNLLSQFYTAQEAWDVGLVGLQGQSALLAADLEVLRSLGGVLGVSNREDQQRHLMSAIRRLEAMNSLAVQDSHQSERLWRYLGVMVGIVIVIILI